MNNTLWAIIMREAAQHHPKPIVITMNSGLTHCLPTWTPHEGGGGAVISGRPIPGLDVLISFDQVAAVQFVKAIPTIMMRAAYSPFEEDENKNEDLFPNSLDASRGIMREENTGEEQTL